MLGKDRILAATSAAATKRKKFLVLLALLGFFLGMCIALMRLGDPLRETEPSSRAGVGVQQTSELLDTIRNLERDVSKLKKDLASEKNKDKECAVGGDRHTVWGPSAERDATDPEFGEFLRKVAIDNEVLVAVSNINYAQKGGMLDLWMDGVQRSGVRNAMVVALDEETKQNVEARGMNAFLFRMEIPESQVCQHPCSIVRTRPGCLS